MISTWVFIMFSTVGYLKLLSIAHNSTLQNLAPNTHSMLRLYVVLLSFLSLPFPFVPTGLRYARYTSHTRTA